MDFSVLVDQFFALTIDGIALGFIYSLIALGYTMVYGVLRLINFANSEVFMLGTFATIITSKNIFGYADDTEPLTGMKLVYTLLACMLVSMLVCAITGVLVEIIAYRRLRKMGSNRLTTLISAIGVSIVISETVRILTSSAPANNPRLLDKIYLISYMGTEFNIGSVRIPVSAFEVRLDTLLVIIFAILLLFSVDRFVKHSRLGKGIRAVSMSEQNSQLMGVNLNKVISSTFFIAGLMTGAAAFFYTTVYESTKFNVGFELGLAAFTAAVLGGIGNIRGAFFGGIALGILEIYAATIFGTQWKAVTAFVVLVLVLLFKPNGLFGESLQQARV